VSEAVLCRIPASTGLAADWIKPGLGAAESVKVSETVATPNLTTVPAENRLLVFRFLHDVGRQAFFLDEAHIIDV